MIGGIQEHKDAKEADAEQERIKQMLRSNVAKASGTEPAAELTLPAATANPSAWTLKAETVDGRTVLHARYKEGVTFVIRCDRTESVQLDESVLAIGSVTVTAGDAILASCQRLTLPLTRDRLALEGDAAIRWRAGTTAWESRGERLTLAASETAALPKQE
jgi:hypothetical protein